MEEKPEKNLEDVPKEEIEIIEKNGPLEELEPESSSENEMLENQEIEIIEKGGPLEELEPESSSENQMLENQEIEIIEKNGPLEELEPEPSLENEMLENQEIENLESPKFNQGSSGTIELDEEALKLQLREFHRNLIEASLYAAGSPLTIEELSTKLEFPKKEVEELINELAFDYLERTTALVIAQIGERYQMQIRPEYTEQVSKFAKGGAIAEKYLRTLTVIALKQPLLKSTLIKIRGTGAYEHVKYLIDNGFIDAMKKGRSHELTTTDKYADMFGLPKNKTELKRAMITQLGIEEASRSVQPNENVLDNENELDEENELDDENEEEET